MLIRKIMTAAVVSLAVAGFTAGSAGVAMADAGQKCEKSAAKALQSCVKLATKAMTKCYNATGSMCDESDSNIQKALGKAAKSVNKCENDAAAVSAGYGPLFTVAGLGERVEEFCLAEARSWAARTYGGPQGTAVEITLPQFLDCISGAAKSGSKHLSLAAKTNSKCVQKQRKSGNCDTAKTAAKITKSRDKAAAKINDACAITPLQDLVALNTDQYLAAAETQADCMLATTHPDVAPLDIDCGPRAEVPVPTRGVNTQIVLPNATWGTKCGDGSDYAFWIRLAEVGNPVENVVIGMQGGGVCIGESDCSSVPPGLYEAQSDAIEDEGIMSNDDLVSPLADYTKVYLPYCTQDVFSGGGTTTDFGSISVERFGGINTRTVLRYVRDVIWNELDQTTAAGYSPEKMRVYFGGFSAGGFGALYNYHYVLDDLQWRHTTAFPDSSLGLDTGEFASVATLGTIVIPATPPSGWDNLRFLPPYCFDTDCPVGPVMLNATAPRLKDVPAQQFAIISPQNDPTQISTTFFADEVAFINELRTQYCATKDLTGVNYFIPGDTTPLHVIANTDANFTTLSVDGTSMTDWIANSVSDPDTLPDLASEGTATTDFPGVAAFPCSVAP